MTGREDGDVDLAAGGRWSLTCFENVPAGASPDCNRNLIPDGCERDCDASGLPDDCDVSLGAASDCDGNRIPDTCDPDCDADGIPDACQVGAGAARDCDQDGLLDFCDPHDWNVNGVPDSCDIRDGASADCNTNGVPDEAELAAHLDLVGHELEAPVPTPYYHYRDLLAVDLDQDGLTDLVSDPGRRTSKFWVLRNDGAPFGPPRFRFTAHETVRAGIAAAGDVDQDGDIDLVGRDDWLHCQWRASVAVLDNNGRGVLRRTWQGPSGPDSPRDDLDGLLIDTTGDGRLDLVTGSALGVWVLVGDASGGFSGPQPYLQWPEESVDPLGRLHAADVDGDGDPDLAIENGLLLVNGGRLDHASSWILDDGVPLDPPFALGDFDGDLDLDVATATQLIENDGSGKYRRGARYGDGEDARLLSVDLDVNGEAEIVRSTSQRVDRWSRRGDGFAASTVLSRSAFTLEALKLAAGDWDGDGATDLAAGTDHLRITLHLNPGGGEFDARAIFHDGRTSGRIRAGDLDGDANLELVAPGNVEGRLGLRLFRPRGDGTLAEERVPLDAGDGGGFATPFDLDGDGAAEVAVGTSRETALFRRDPAGAWPRWRNTTLGPGLTDVLAADLDQDGDVDLLGKGGAQPRLTGVLQEPATEWTRDFFVKVDAWLGSVAVADLNGDDILDLLAVEREMLVRADGSGGAVFAPFAPVELVPPGEPRSQAVAAAPADFDADGSLDIAASSQDHLTFFWNRGGGGFEPGPRLPARGRAESLTVADLDLDGDLDLVAPQTEAHIEDFIESGHEVAVYVNAGRGRFGLWGYAPTGTGPNFANVLRVDGDGYPDLVVGTRQHGFSVVWNRTRPALEDADGDGLLDLCRATPFRRGDWIQDGDINLTDAVSLLGHLFLGRPSEGCPAAGDLDDDGRLLVTDALYLVRHLFLGGAPPPAPFPGCGRPQRPGGLDCRAYVGCR